MKESKEQEKLQFNASVEVLREGYEDENVEMKGMEDPISFAASADPDTIYYHQAMQEPD